MSKWAYVENNSVIQVLDNLPTNWRNISNFFALESDINFLQTLGWYQVENNYVKYDPNQYYVSGTNFSYANNKVTKSLVLTAITPPTPLELQVILNNKWQAVRDERDLRMREFEWRYTRYFRQQRLGLPTTDNLNNIDSYMQQLANITTQEDPDNIVWPTF